MNMLEEEPENIFIKPTSEKIKVSNNFKKLAIILVRNVKILNVIYYVCF